LSVGSVLASSSREWCPLRGRQHSQPFSETVRQAAKLRHDRIRSVPCLARPKPPPTPSQLGPVHGTVPPEVDNAPRIESIHARRYRHLIDTFAVTDGGSVTCRVCPLWLLHAADGDSWAPAAEAPSDRRHPRQQACMSSTLHPERLHRPAFARTE